MKNLKLYFAIALLLCLLPMPYGFYTLIRIFSMVFFGFLALDYYGRKNEKMAITFGALAVVFQPFIKIVLGREVWNMVDVIVAALLVYLWYKERKH